MKRMTAHIALADRLCILPRQLTRLKTLVNEAEQAQVKEMNEPNAPDAQPACSRFQNYARKLGFETKWPGIFPVLLKDGKEILVDW